MHTLAYHWKGHKQNLCHLPTLNPAVCGGRIGTSLRFVKLAQSGKSHSIACSSVGHCAPKGNLQAPGRVSDLRAPIILKYVHLTSERPFLEKFERCWAT